jgi:hypothetical protein
MTTSPTPGAAWSVRSVRDLTLVRIDENTELCIACDSSGAYGEKPQDVRSASGFDVGFAVSKVPLMEVLAAGAVPRVLVDNLCVELDPFGLRILDGVRAACAATGYEIAITGSDETNFPTVMTGVGTTVVASLSGDRSRLGTTSVGDEIYAVGQPLGGVDPEGAYDSGAEDVAGIDTVLRLLSTAGVREILPVGSRGIAYETGQLAATIGGDLDWDPSCTVDLARSAGASTALVCSVEVQAREEFLRAFPRASRVATLRAASTH